MVGDPRTIPLHNATDIERGEAKMNVLMSILKGAGTFIDKIVPVAVGGRTKYAAILAAVVPFVKSTFPEYAPLLDHVQTVAIDLAALFGYAGLVR